jgi:A/G-specific adenine glycosylase
LNPNLRDGIADHVLVTSARTRTRFGTALLAWFDKNQRSLPWREDRSPYRVWLSEIMLQQTRVNAVFDHYRGFLDGFPDVFALAAAPLDRVLAAWSGLGYYRRARALHQAAQFIVHDLGGAFPATADAWRELPGVGRYTAAAIASIAFGERCAVVDGNVERALSRLLARKLTSSEQWSLADSLLGNSCPGDFNQAFMELGATVCTPRLPQCRQCPVTSWCASRKSIAAGPLNPSVCSSHISSKSDAQKTSTSGGSRKKSCLDLLLCRRGSSVALVQRSERDSKMAGMWDLPAVASSAASGRVDRPLLMVRHSITVTDYAVTVHDGGGSRPVGARWIPVAELASLPLTGLARKILRRLQVI